MGRQIRLLTRISLCNLLGINEYRYTKDSRKKVRYRWMAVLWGVLLLMMAGYAGGLSYVLIYMGMGFYVPAVLTMCVSMVVFIFTMLKAGAVLFDRGAYEKQIALPVSVRAVIVSRFLSMYVTNMFFGVLVMLPGMAVYGVMERPGVTFYLYGILGSLFLPLLPLTLASVVGAVIFGISSRWRRKNLVAIVLTLAFICVVLAGSFGMAEMEGELWDMLNQLAPLMEEQIRSVYPPGIWLSEAMAYGKVEMLFCFLALSLGCFILFLEILRPFYAKICTLLGAHGAKGNYQMKDMKSRPVLRSMVERELRRYFSSVIYVSNTIVGNLLMVLMAVGVLVTGKEYLEKMLGIEGVVDRGLPVLLGLVAGLMPMSSCSISMEGKQWWMMQTFPVTGRNLVRSKVWADVLVALPFYLVAEVLLFIALRPDFLGLISLLAVPAVYIVYSAVVGITVNCRFPLLEWENEARVVKQSASTMLTMLICMLTGIVPLVIVVVGGNLPAFAVNMVLAAVLTGATVALEYRVSRNCRLI